MSTREEEKYGYEPIIKALMKALRDIKGSLMDFLKPLTFDWNSSEYENFQLFIKDMESWYTLQGIPDKAVVDLRGGMRDVYPLGGKFFQIHAVFGENWQNCMLAPPWGVGAPSLGKSWIHHCKVSPVPAQLLGSHQMKKAQAVEPLWHNH